MRRILAAASVLAIASCLLSVLAIAQSGSDQMSIASVSSTHFSHLQVLPSCMTLSAVHGDPSNGAATILAKVEANCLIAWHWHSANEQLMFLAGNGTLEVRGQEPHEVKNGDYVFLPAKEVHQFTCTATCLFYDVIDGAFDIHYVDRNGNELPAAEVIKRQPKPPTSKQ